MYQLCISYVSAMYQLCISYVSAMYQLCISYVSAMATTGWKQAQICQAGLLGSCTSCTKKNFNRTSQPEPQRRIRPLDGHMASLLVAGPWQKQHLAWLGTAGLTVFQLELHLGCRRFPQFHHPWRIHGAGRKMLTLIGGISWGDPWSTIYSNI